MIARLKGLLDSASAESCVIDVGGVGYLVSASSKTLGALGPIGSAAVLHIETQVREDAIQLFGFLSIGERDSFRLLTSVQGVGGRVALALVSVLAPDELAHAIAVGPKLAARIANELKGKFGAVALGSAAPLAVGSGGGDVADALSALAGLGFRPMDASRAVAEAQAELGEGAAVRDLIRVALKKSAR
jgi:Holliday junction DNA helicase RuvA